MDEFLGQVTLPLNEMDAYERPRSKWFKLQSKPSKEKKDKERGELEVRIAFTVKAGSLTNLSKNEKNKSSTLGIGGSLLSLGSIEKRKSLKKFAQSLGSKVSNGLRSNFFVLLSKAKTDAKLIPFGRFTSLENPRRTSQTGITNQSQAVYRASELQAVQRFERTGIMVDKLWAKLIQALSARTMMNSLSIICPTKVLPVRSI